MTKKQSELIQVLYRIKSIKELEFQFQSKNIDDLDCSKCNFKFTTSYGQSFHIENSEIHNVFEFKVYPNPRSRKPIANHSVLVVFEIKDIKNYVKPNKELTLPNILVASMIQITIGTTRGLWFSRVKGTPIENAILPILDTKAFMEGLMAPEKTPVKKKSIKKPGPKRAVPKKLKK